VYTMQGALMGRFAASQNWHEINTANWPSGMYIVEVIKGSSRLQSKLVIAR
jgi:hypothetical protein